MNSIIGDASWNTVQLAASVYYWVLFLVGLVASVWGFKKTKEKIFLLFAVFFTSPVIGLFQMDGSSFGYYGLKLMKSEQSNGMIYMFKSINLSVFETVLVVAVVLLVKQKVSTANQALDSIGTSSAGTDRVS